MTLEHKEILISGPQIVIFFLCDNQDSATLFEVQVPEFRLLQQCRKEIKMLKQLWDYIFLVRTSIDEWKTTPWKVLFWKPKLPSTAQPHTFLN